MTRSTFNGLRDSASPYMSQIKPEARPKTSKSVSRLSIKSIQGTSKPASRVSGTRQLSNLGEKIREDVGILNSRPRSKMSGVSAERANYEEIHEQAEDLNIKGDSKALNIPVTESIKRPQTGSSKASSQNIKNVSVKSINPLTLKYPKPSESIPDQASRPGSSHYSVQSKLSNENSDSLKLYISELENLLRQEKLKRIQSEEMLKKYVTRTPITNH